MIRGEAIEPGEGATFMISVPTEGPTDRPRDYGQLVT